MQFVRTSNCRAFQSSRVSSFESLEARRLSAIDSSVSTPAFSHLFSHDVPPAFVAPPKSGQLPSAYAASSSSDSKQNGDSHNSNIHLFFSSAVKNAIALVPTTAGKLEITKVINFGTTIYKGPLSVANTLSRIRANGSALSSNDGTVYNNNSGVLPSGTWYEFVVDPKSGTDRNFSSQFTSPGPMRVVLSNRGVVYFTGDHYSHFQLVYRPHGMFGVPDEIIVSRNDSELQTTTVNDLDRDDLRSTTPLIVDSYFAHVAYQIDLKQAIPK